MSEVFREKVGENPEQRQTTDAVASENPCSTAFMLSGGSRGLLGRRNDRGPIFHAKKPPTERSWRTYVMRHACLATGRRRTIWTAILPRIGALGREKCDHNHKIIVQMAWHNRKTHTLKELQGIAAPKAVI